MRNVDRSFSPVTCDSVSVHQISRDDLERHYINVQKLRQLEALLRGLNYERKVAVREMLEIEERNPIAIETDLDRFSSIVR